MNQTTSAPISIVGDRNSPTQTGPANYPAERSSGKKGKSFGNKTRHAKIKDYVEKAENGLSMSPKTRNRFVGKMGQKEKDELVETMNMDFPIDVRGIPEAAGETQTMGITS